MKKYARLLIFSILLLQLDVFADPLPTPDGNPMFSQQELDQMLAPIALYPDSLISQVLVAATYPLEVVQAAHWSSANSALSGDAAVQAVEDQSWDISVKTLVAFPQILQTLENKIDWTERLGDAFISQQYQVMDTIQKLRQKAQSAGNLSSNSQMSVSQSDGNIELTPTNPEVIYVPYYDSTTVYGPWWWESYPPVFWAPWTGYARDGWFSWGVGIGVGAGIFIGLWDWHNHIFYGHDPHHPGDDGKPWWHDPRHRHDVPYRNPSLNQQYGRIGANGPRSEFRGHDLSLPPGESHNRAQAEGEVGEHPKSIEPRVHRNLGRSPVELRAHAFENVGRGAAVRTYSERGHASLKVGVSAPATSRGQAHSKEH